MPTPIVAIGIPAALGGWLPGREEAVAGMAAAPAGLRAGGLLERIVSTPDLGGADLVDVGDVSVDPAVSADDDRRAKNRDQLVAFLPRAAASIAGALDDAAPESRLLVLGGDCLAHAAALAGLRRSRPAARLALAWFDAHGDFNTPETTPSGNVWGMPFAMACGRGDPDLVDACDGPSVAEADCALLGGQALDEPESRAIAASPIAHFGAGMLATDAGRAALRAWATVVSERVDGMYIAVDHDVLDGAGGWAVTFPEPAGLAPETLERAIRIIAEVIPVVGFGATGISLLAGDAGKTIDAAAGGAIVALATG